LNADRFFETAHLHADLKGRSIRGGAVTFLAQVAKFVIQIGSTAVLARLLMPADFGLVAMVSAVTGLIGSFGDLGLSSATIQRADVTHRQVSTLFWINMAVSLLISAIVAALAPGIAWFYHEPRLTWITLVSAGGIVFGGLTTQHYALLTRQMRFGAMALVQTLPQLASVLVAIVLAMAGWGYWALVLMGIVAGAGTAMVSWIASGWRPGLPSRTSGVGSMLAFGGHLTGFNLLNYLTRNADNILIGRFLGAGSLGIYSKAYGLLMFPVQQINAPVNGVVLPALSRLQSQPDRYRRYFCRAVEGIAFIGMPIIIFSFVDARFVVLTVLGVKWIGAVDIFRLLAPAALVGTINSAPAWIFTSLGRADRQFLWAAISTPIILAGFIIGLKWGVAGVAASFSVTFTLCFVLFALDACRHSPIRLRDFALALAPPLCASAVATLVTGVIGLHLNLPAAGRLALDAGIFSAVYAAVSIAFPSGRSFLKSLLAQGGLKSRNGWNAEF
jgi:PST family polysaccharide transporter